MGALRHASLAAAVVLGSTALVACGGGGGNSEADQISKVIQTSVTSTNPADCTRYETQRFLDQTEFQTGAAAVKSCQTGAADRRVDSAKVSSVSIKGGMASASEALTGGSFDGQALNVSLAKVGGQWKLDHIDSFATFDKAKFIAAFKTASAAGKSATTPQQADCLAKQLEPLSDTQIEDLFLSATTTKLVQVFGVCLQ